MCLSFVALVLLYDICMCVSERESVCVIVFITTNRPMLVDPESGGFTFTVQIRLVIVAESQLTERLERVHSDFRAPHPRYTTSSKIK